MVYIATLTFISDVNLNSVNRSLPKYTMSYPSLRFNRDEELPAVYLAFFYRVPEMLELMSYDHFSIFSKAQFSHIQFI